MTKYNLGSETPQSRNPEIEALVGRYLNLNNDEIAKLKHWFSKEASAFDVATLASQESIYYGYRRFREEHVDRLGLREWVVIASIMIAFLAASVAAYALIE
ncbi:MAG: hypothetical protein GW858_01285 [Sphingomonadales bacterium]|nr:hypothetical protein [Sphingomonadales bacterium]